MDGWMDGFRDNSALVQRLVVVSLTATRSVYRTHTHTHTHTHTGLMPLCMYGYVISTVSRTNAALMLAADNK